MGIKEDYQEAVALVKQGNYKQAQSILMIHDHPKTNILLDKVNKAISSQPSTRETEKSFTIKLVVSIVLLFVLIVPGVIATLIFVQEAKKYPDAPGAKGLVWLNRVIFISIILFILSLFLIMALGSTGVGSVFIYTLF